MDTVGITDVTGSSFQSPVSGAFSAAHQAARRAGVTTATVSSAEELATVVELFRKVWVDDRGEGQVGVPFLRALVHEGSYLAGAFRAGELVAASLGFLGVREGTKPHLHSHVSAVVPGLQGASIGFALKQHQRWWALSHGLDTITWTFDPLVRRNAYFNLVKLGAEISAFEQDFYGAMDDGINKGDESDRCFITWRLSSSRAEKASRGDSTQLDIPPEAEVILQEDRRGHPVPTPEFRGDVLTAWIPEDILALRQTSLDKARLWRHALRRSFGRALEQGFTGSTITRSGWYLLRRTK